MCCDFRSSISFEKCNVVIRTNQPTVFNERVIKKIGNQLVNIHPALNFNLMAEHSFMRHNPQPAEMQPPT
jgi:hypothetical protein